MIKFLKQYLASLGGSCVAQDSQKQYIESLQHRITALEAQVNNLERLCDDYERMVAVQKRMLDLDKNKIAELERNLATKRDIIAAYDRLTDTAKLEQRPHKLHRLDWELIDGKWTHVTKAEIYGWCSVNTETGEVELDDFNQFDDNLRELLDGWTWQRFTLTPSTN